MREQHRQINIDRSIAVQNQFNLMDCLFHIHKRSDQLILTRDPDHFFRQQSDEQNLHSIHFLDEIRKKQSAVVQRYVEIRIDDREIGTLLQKQ